MPIDCVILGNSDRSFPRDERMQEIAAGNIRGMTATGGMIARGHIGRQRLYIDGKWRRPMDGVSYLADRPVVGNTNGARQRWTMGEQPHVASFYLASYLYGHGGISSKIINFFPAELAELRALLTEQQPLAVVVPTTMYTQPFPVVEIVQFIRAHNPDTKIIVGGPYVTLLKDSAPDDVVDGLVQLGRASGASPRSQAFELLGADVYVVEFQGELTLGRVMRALKAGDELDSIPNLYIKRGGRFVSTGREEENNSLDECSIDWEMFTPSELGTSVGLRTARSCAFKCAFCNYPLLGDLANASLETIEKELRKLERRGVKNLWFADDTFNVPAKRFEDMMRMMIRNNFEFRWHAFIRCGNLRWKMVEDLLEPAGLDSAFLGIESGDQTILGNMNKDVPLARLTEGVTKLKERNVDIELSLIVGYPGETWDTVQNTIDFVNTTAPTYFKTSIFFYDPRAPIAKDAEKFGLTGAFFDWKHDTMDVVTAMQAQDYLNASVTNSLRMPQEYYTAWVITYLKGKGYSSKDIYALTSRLMDHIGANSLPKSDTANAYRAEVETELKTWIQAHPLADARYQLEDATPLDEPSFALRVDEKVLQIQQVIANKSANKQPRGLQG